LEILKITSQKDQIKDQIKRSYKKEINALKLGLAAALIYGGYNFINKKPLPTPLPTPPTEIIEQNKFIAAKGQQKIQTCEKEEYTLKEDEIINKKELLTNCYTEFLNKIESITLFMNENNIEKDVNNYFFENREKYFIKCAIYSQQGMNRVVGNFLVNKCTDLYGLKNIENCEKFFIVDSILDPIFKKTEGFDMDFIQDKQLKN
jgi:hypothetical protein